MGYSVKDVDPIIEKIKEEKSNQFKESGTSILFDFENMENSISDFSCVKKNIEIQEELKALKNTEFSNNIISDSNNNINSTAFTENLLHS